VHFFFVLAERSATKRFRVRLQEGYRIRSFKPDDEKNLSSIHKITFGEAVSTKAYKIWASSPNYRAILVTDSSKPVGFIIAERCPCLSMGLEASGFHILVIIYGFHRVRGRYRRRFPSGSVNSENRGTGRVCFFGGFASLLLRRFSSFLSQCPDSSRPTDGTRHGHGAIST
jgi:hypothetical protein